MPTKAEVPIKVRVANLFRLSKPEQVTGRDGKKYVLSFTYGHERSFTKDEFYAAVHGTKPRQPTTANGVLDQQRKRAQVEYSKRCFTNELRRVSDPQGLAPLFGQIPLMRNEKPRFYVAGFSNSNGDPVLGDINHIGLWAIKFKKFRRNFEGWMELGDQVTKRVLKLNLRHDIKEELMRIASA